MRQVSKNISDFVTRVKYLDYELRWVAILIVINGDIKIILASFVHTCKLHLWFNYYDILLNV
jgi:hypothetical protein